MVKRKSQLGFTLIEIMLVLAIAGLVIVMVFVALSHIQKDKRDKKRQADAARYLSGATEVAGYIYELPTYDIRYEGFLSGRGATFNDPKLASPYRVFVATTTPKVCGPQCNFTIAATPPAAPPGPGQLYAYRGYTCSGPSITPAGAVPANLPRRFAVEIYQEIGGSYCVSN
jgi:prepilin-type N-terminal cleavage/methylation domain-containing protein